MKKLLAVLGLISLMIIPAGVFALDHEGIASVALSPQTPQTPTVKAGENITFTLTAKDNAGITWDITAGATYQVNDPRGEMTANVYLAGKVGTWTVNAVYGNFTAQTSVQVLPGDLATIEVNPNSQPEIINLGSLKTFTAEGFDKMSNLLPGLTFTWSQEGNLGDINQKGVFSAENTGQGKIIASLNSISGFSAIKVKEKTAVPVTTTNVSTAKPKINANTNVSDTAGQVAGAETAQTEETNATSDACKTLAWYWWLLIMIGFFAVLILYYFFIRKAKGGWWWIFPLILTAAVIWLYYQYACNKYGWWPWVTIIMAILITLFRPKKYFEEPKSPTF